MFNAKFISNCLSENIDDIKIAALYYDKIDILRNTVVTLTHPKTEIINGQKREVARVRGIHDCLTNEFVDNLKILEQEGIIGYFDIEEYTISPVESNDEPEIPQLMKLAMEQTKYLLSKADKELWFQKNDDRNLFSFHPEAMHIHKNFISDFTVGSPVDFEFIYKYYRNLLNYLLFNFSSGEITLTSSALLDNYIKSMYIQTLRKEARYDFDIKKYGLPQISAEAIKLFLPNVSQMPLEDILELRFKLKDELEKFRYFSLKLNKEIEETFDYKDIVCNTQRCVDLTLKPAINELTEKIKGTRLSIASKFIDELKDPKSYAPLIGSLLVNWPYHLTILLSLGLAGSKLALESYKEISEVKQNGLYYLIKLRENAI